MLGCVGVGAREGGGSRMWGAFGGVGGRASCTWWHLALTATPHSLSRLALMVAGVCYVMQLWASISP